MVKERNVSNLKTVAGKVENIFYHDPKSGRSVLSVVREDDRACRVIGNIMDVEVGCSITATGLWKKDEKYGWQFVAETLLRDMDVKAPVDDGLMHAIDFSNVLGRPRKAFRDTYKTIDYYDSEYVLADEYYSSKETADRKIVDGAVYDADMTTLISVPDQPSFTIPDTVLHIGDRAFNRCKSLISIMIPQGVSRIGERAFSNCRGLKSICIPGSVTEIGYGAFNGCNGLIHMDITDCVCDLFLRSCSSLVEINASESNIRYSSVDGVLYSKDKLMLIAYPSGRGDTHFAIPEGVAGIGEKAFSCSSVLASIYVPDSVISIYGYAFCACSGLTSMEIPGSVTTIGTNAFACPALTSVTIRGIYGRGKLMIERPVSVKVALEEFENWIVCFNRLGQSGESRYLRFLSEKHVANKYTVCPVVEYVGGHKEYGALFTLSISGRPHIVWENFNDARATYVFPCTNDNYEEMRKGIMAFLHHPKIDCKRSYLRSNGCQSVFGEKPHMVAHNDFLSWKQRLLDIDGRQE